MLSLMGLRLRPLNVKAGVLWVPACAGTTR
jgi:hypothetical protein